MRSVASCLVVALATAAFSSATAAQGLIVPRQCLPRTVPSESPASNIACLPIHAATVIRTGTDVHVELRDGILHYEVDERFRNPGAMVGEADYLFPLPKGAAFQDLQLSMNGELVSGETLGADEARQIYEEIVRKQRDPALVQWMGYGLLRARIFPINAGEEKRVVVRFQSVAEREGDAVRVDYFGGASPAAGARGGAGVGDGPVNLTLTYPANGTYGPAYSPTHELDVRDDQGQRVVTVRGDARDATILVAVSSSNAAGISLLTNAPGGEDGFALVTVSPPASATRTGDVMPRDVTLVLDVSGSMQGAKIEQARAAGKQLLATLRPQDRFRLIDFSTDVRTFRDELSNATTENVRQADRYLESLEAGGSTNIAGALTEAMRGVTAAGRLPLVLFITDGEPTIGTRDPIELVKLVHTANATPGAEPRRLFTFGLGTDVNPALLDQLAMEGRGTSQYVRPDESVERAVDIVASRLVDPVLTNVTVRAEGNVRLTKLLPGAGADLFAGQDLVVLARYSGSGSSRLVVEGTRRGSQVRWTSTVTFPDRDRANGFVARLRATQRVGFLSAEEGKDGSSPEVDDEIRSLGERFGIPTKFTSYLVQEPLTAGNGVLRPVNGRFGGAAGGGGAGGGGGGGGRGGRASGTLAAASGAAPSPDRSKRFELAAVAAAQRDASTLATADSVSRTFHLVATKAGTAAAASPVREINGRTFTLADSVWTDARPHAGIPTVTVQAYSPAYFDLLARLPELAPLFALGDRLTAVGRSVVISVRPGSEGVTALSKADMQRTVDAW